MGKIIKLSALLYVLSALFQQGCTPLNNEQKESTKVASTKIFSFRALSPGDPRKWYQKGLPLPPDLRTRAMKFEEISAYSEYNYQTLYMIDSLKLDCMIAYVIGKRVHNSTEDYLFLIGRRQGREEDFLLTLATMDFTRFGNERQTCLLKGDSLLFERVVDSFRGKQKYKDSVWWSLKIDSNCEFQPIKRDSIRKYYQSFP